jgi:hypothetical protein
MPSLRSCSVGPPRWAIHGPTRLNRHPCRFTHYAEPERSLTMGQENQKPKQRQKRGELTLDLVVRWYASPVGAGLPAKVVNDDAGILTPRGALRFFASRLAPTSTSLAVDPCTPERQWSAVRPPSPASRLLQVDRCTSAGDWSAVRLPSPASQLPTGFSRFSPIKRCKNAYNVVISAYTFLLYKYLII